MPKTISPIERRKKLIEDFGRQRTQQSGLCETFEPLKPFTNDRASKEVDKWYTMLKGGASFEK